MRHEAALAFFKLHGAPFGKEVSVADLWSDPSREQAVERLVEAMHRRQHALVCGEPGVGKNCVTRAMKSRLSETAFRVVYIANVTVGRRDFYRQLSLVLGLQPRGTIAAVFEGVQREVRGSWTEHRVHPVLVIDEAHLMPDTMLSHLHVLCNFDMDSRPLLSLVLVGLPELQDRLRLGVHRSLLTRIRTRVEIGMTTSEDTAAYVRHRLDRAGATRDIFASDGMTLLHELAAGVPRILDAIAEGAMVDAASRDESLITRATVRRAWQDTPFG
jgi:general secretion pathway protein A